jgi:hypothetical protein
MVANALRRGIDDAAEAGDADTSDIFSAASRDLDKALWFLEAHVQGSSFRDPLNEFSCHGHRYRTSG